MVHQFKYQKGVATIAFNGFDDLPTTQQPVTVNGVFYPTFTAKIVSPYSKEFVAVLNLL